MKKPPIYLDYAATTPVDPHVAKKMQQALTMEGSFGNPASRSHYYGWQAESLVENARYQVASLLKADPREIIWTSGATESNNLAIKGAAQFYKAAEPMKNRSSRASGDQIQKRHIITSKIEHKAVLDCCEYLEQDRFEVTYLEPDEGGTIDPIQVSDAIRPETFLVSLMHINNELGTINDIGKIAEITRANDILFHVDAAQSVGKIELDLQSIQVDLLSISAHKCYGPKGIGALFIRRRLSVASQPSVSKQQGVSRQQNVTLVPQIHGGGHERGFRSGTLATHQIIGLGEACALAVQALKSDSSTFTALCDQLYKGLIAIEGVGLNGCLAKKYPGILNLSFPFVDGESLMIALNGLAVSSGSACTSAQLEPSYVLRAIGLDRELAHSSIRFSLGRYTTSADVASAIDEVSRAVNKLREVSPNWQEYKSKTSA